MNTEISTHRETLQDSRKKNKNRINKLPECQTCEKMAAYL